LVIVIHHMAIDGVSWRVLLEDLQTAYQQLAAGAPLQLPAKTTSFKAWATRLEEYAQSGALDAERSYWLDPRRAQIAPLPTDFSVERIANTVTSGHIVTVQLSAAETQSLLQEVPQAYNTQINDVLLTALAQVLAAWTGTKSVLFSLEGHGREDLFEDIDVSRTVGWFTSRFPVLLELGEETEPGTLLPAIKEQVRGIPNRGIGYGMLRYLRQDADAMALGALPQPDVEFNYLGQLDQTLSNEELLFQLAAETTGPDVGPDNPLSHLLIINGQVVGGQLEVSWTFSTRLYREQTIAQLAEHFLTALRALIAHCLSPEAGGSTPSDFPLAQIDTQTLDDLIEFVEFEE
jgi:non-ribosomal peptide synthase protein (TIGR01720 family)